MFRRLLYDPRREISHVDVLHPTVFVVRGQHFAAGGDPARPVRETVRGIVRTRDQTWTDVQNPARHHLLSGPLAQRLEPPVSLPRDLLDRRIRELLYRRLFVGPGRDGIGVYGDARDERVMVHSTGQKPGRRPDGAGHVAAGVDHRVPAPPQKGREIPVAVALDLLYLGEHPWLSEPPVEERRPMTVRERRLDEVAPEESRAAEYQYVHLSLLGVRTTNSPSYTEALLACRDGVFTRPVDDPVDNAVLERLLWSQHVVAVGVAFDLLDGLPRHLGIQFVHPLPGPYEFPGMDLYVRDLPAEAPADVRLVQQYPRVGERAPLALRPRRKEERPHRGRHPKRRRRHIRVDELHGIV